MISIEFSRRSGWVDFVVKSGVGKDIMEATFAMGVDGVGIHQHCHASQRRSGPAGK